MKYFGFIIIVLVAFYCFQNYFFESQLIGYYNNVNYVNNIIAETPTSTDTLVLDSNHKFRSDFYGEGEYLISHTFWGTEISLFYENSGIVRPIKRSWFSAPRIILDSDLNHYYKKNR